MISLILSVSCRKVNCFVNDLADELTLDLHEATLAYTTEVSIIICIMLTT